MNLYETTFIVNPQAEESAIDEQVKAIGKVIADNGGKIIREERMGTRRLAYP
ncbi:MAG: 30S ribosomal protein S6, partial [Candidatus Zixiibacteriota bacterium]